METAFVQKVIELLNRKQSFVVVTLAKVWISAPQKAGAKLIVGADGYLWGTIGGGKLEHKAIEYACEMVNRARTEEHFEWVRWNLKADVGMTCGGEVGLTFEPVNLVPWPIKVFGAGHVAQALVPLLSTLPCEVEVFDPRVEWIRRMPLHPKITLHCVDDMAVAAKNLVRAIGINPHEKHPRKLLTSFVILTQGHSFDLPILHEILFELEPFYVGVMGSRSKATVLQRELKAKGVLQERINKLHCPIGLAIGGRSPHEIAVGIAAQLLQCRYAHA